MTRFKAFLSGVLLCALFGVSQISFAQAQWSQYGKDAQHTGAVTTGIQRLKSILWQTPVDLYPPYAGTDLLIHYGSTLVSKQGTILVTVRTGDTSGQFPPGSNTFRIDGRNHDTGEMVWSENTDWVPPPYSWIPPCGSAIGRDNRVWTPGSGGTVYVRASADVANVPVSQVAFYGIGSYQANPALFDSDVRICTPITIDNAGNAYFGVWVADNSATGLTSGIARIAADGTGIFMPADTITGVTHEQPCYNASPALSNDGTKLYVAIKSADRYTSHTNNFIASLDSTTLSLINITPASNPGGSTPYFTNDSSGTILVGTDGDVYFGTLSNGNLWSRGFMMHFSGDLQTAKPMGAFGWDDTASLVPSVAVPSYGGTSPYLVLTKYNNYADEGLYGDGKNRIAVLDPNATEQYTVQYGSHYTPPYGTGPTYTCMKEIISVLGVTPNTNLYSDGTPYDGFREWCINDAVVDVAGKAAIINSEDGHCYRWDFTLNKVTDNVPLAPPTGEAYTPTIASADGLAFAVNNAQLCVMWDGAGPASITFNPPSVAAGNSSTGTVKLAVAASGPGATLKLVSGNPHIHVPATIFVPAGSNIGTFSVTTDKSTTDLTGTITASRYNVSASTTSFVATGSGTSTFNGFTVNNSSPTMSYAITGTVTFASPAVQNTTLSATTSDQYIKVSAPPTMPTGQKTTTFTMYAALLPTLQAHSTTVTVSDSRGVSIPRVISIQPITLSVPNPSTITLHSNDTTLVGFSLSTAPGSYNISPKVNCSDSHVIVPVQMNFAPGHSNTVVRISTGAISAPGSATIFVGPLCGLTRQITVNYAP